METEPFVVEKQHRPSYLTKGSYFRTMKRFCQCSAWWINEILLKLLREQESVRHSSIIEKLTPVLMRNDENYILGALCITCNSSTDSSWSLLCYSASYFPTATCLLTTSENEAIKNPTSFCIPTQSYILISCEFPCSLLSTL